MPATHIQITVCNATEHSQLCTELIPLEDQPSSGLYHKFKREYGRCTGHCFVDIADQQAIAVGWVFVKRVKYTDCDETYLQETWVSFVHIEPRKITQVPLAS